MTVNGKRDDFTLDDLLSVASQVRGMDARRIIKEVCEAIAQWPQFAQDAGVPISASKRIGEVHRLYLGEGL
jgi:serine/threonine-protein kinase HipA